MTVGHWLRDHRTETKTNFDCVTHSLKWIEKDYHRARGCVLSPHGLLLNRHCDLNKVLLLAVESLWRSRGRKLKNT